MKEREQNDQRTEQAEEENKRKKKKIKIKYGYTASRTTQESTKHIIFIVDDIYYSDFHCTELYGVCAYGRIGVSFVLFAVCRFTTAENRMEYIHYETLKILN